MTGLVQPFISTVPGSLDSKGRVCIPATYRHLLSAQNTMGVYLCPSFIDPALVRPWGPLLVVPLVVRSVLSVVQL